MGFYYRKSVKFGPFRLNFSKSGIGVSAGIKGARISTGSRGTYVHAGTNGFYYKQKIGGHSYRVPNQPNQQQTPNWQNPTYPQVADNYRIETADVERLVESSSANLINQINAASKEMRFAYFAVAGTLLSSFLVFVILAAILSVLINEQVGSAISIFVATLVLIAGSYFSWKIHKGDELKRTTPLFYELENEALNKFSTVQKACQTLSRSARIWRVQTQQPTWDWKRNAGASSLITRQPVYVKQEQPPYIATNVSVWSIKLNDQALYFMPDYIFIRQNGIYGAVSYESFEVDFSTTRFIEDNAVPPDSRVVDTTWKFVNKKGGPDRRFSNNRQLPIVQYGFVQFQTRSGMNIHLIVSNVEVSKYFADMIYGISSNSRNYKEQRRTSNDYNQSYSSYKVDEKYRAACETLGVSINATQEQIVVAYRQMAKMYHPDRLSHLAPEFVEVAEERMKEINIAYEILKKGKSI
jgi:hypothetical protein